MGGGGSSGPKYLDSVKVSSNNRNDINEDNFIKIPPSRNINENFKGSKIKYYLYKKKNKNNNSLLIFFVILMIIIFILSLIYFSIFKKK